MSDNHLSPAEYRSLNSAASNYSFRVGATVHLIGHTGLRTSEAAAFHPGWFNAQKNYVDVPTEDDGWEVRSPHQARRIPIPSEAADRLDSFLKKLGDDAWRVTSPVISHRVKTAADVAGLDNVSPLILRLTYARRLLALGIRIEIVERILGLRSTPDLHDWTSQPDTDFMPDGRLF